MNDILLAIVLAILCVILIISIVGIAARQKTKPKPRSAVSLLFHTHWKVNNAIHHVITATSKDSLMLTIPKGTTRTLHITPLDADNQPTVFDGMPVWSSTDEAAVSVLASLDGLSAYVTAQRANATASISVSADGAQGEMVRTITGSIDVSVPPADAVSLAIDVVPLDAVAVSIVADPAPADPAVPTA